MLADKQFNLGTAPTGSDGDTARAAGEKYNLHEHPGTVCAILADFTAWQEDEGRKLGDISLFNGIPYLWNGSAAIPLGLGLVAPGAALDSEITLALRQTSNQFVDVLAVDYFDPTTYAIPRITHTVHLKIVIDVLADSETTLVLTDATSVFVKHTASFTRPVAEPAPAVLYISDALDLTDANHCYVLSATNTGLGCIVYKAALLIRYSVEDNE